MNAATVRRQNASVTEPQRDRAHTAQKGLFEKSPF
jgi:hypothetical protein